MFGSNKRFQNADLLYQAKLPAPDAYSQPNGLGPQCSSTKRTAPLPGFGSSTRQHQAKLFMSPAHEKTKGYGKASPGPPARPPAVSVGTPSPRSSVGAPSAAAPSAARPGESRVQAAKREFSERQRQQQKPKGGTKPLKGGSADVFVRDLLLCTERIAGASAAWQLRLIEHGLMERLLGVFLMKVPKPLTLNPKP